MALQEVLRLKINFFFSLLVRMVAAVMVVVALRDTRERHAAIKRLREVIHLFVGGHEREVVAVVVGCVAVPPLRGRLATLTPQQVLAVLLVVCDDVFVRPPDALELTLVVGFDGEASL